MRASSTSTPARPEPLLDLHHQVLVDLLGVAAQRDLVVLVQVVGKARRHLAQRGLGLHVHEVLVIVDVEHGLGGVHHLPHDDRGDLDRVALDVVHLELGRLEVAHPQRHRALGIEGIGVAQPVRARRCRCSCRRTAARRRGWLHDEQAEQQHDQHDAGHEVGQQDADLVRLPAWTPE
jgi:hypothetical protein